MSNGRVLYFSKVNISFIPVSEKQPIFVFAEKSEILIAGVKFCLTKQRTGKQKNFNPPPFPYHVVIFLCIHYRAGIGCINGILFLQDSDILAKHFPSTVQVAYILSLGVVIDFRRHGIGEIYNFLTCSTCFSYITFLHGFSRIPTNI